MAEEPDPFVYISMHATLQNQPNLVAHNLFSIVSPSFSFVPHLKKAREVGRSENAEPLTC